MLAVDVREGTILNATFRFREARAIRSLCSSTRDDTLVLATASHRRRVPDGQYQALVVLHRSRAVHTQSVRGQRGSSV